MNKNIKIRNYLGLILIGIMFCSIVVSFGYGTGYSPNIPLSMYPGEEKTISSNIENPEEEANFKVELMSGSEIAKLTNSGPYTVGKGGAVGVEINIKIPKNANVGQEYFIRTKAIQVAGVGEGGASFSQTIEDVFKVVVVPKPIETETPKSNNTWLWVLGVLVVIVVGWVLWSRKKTEKKGKKGRK